MRKLLILGGGGHGRVVADAARSTCKWQEICFIDAAYPDLKKSGEWRVVGNDDDLADLIDGNTDLAVAIGNNRTRMSLVKKLQQNGYSLPPIVHSTAVVSEGADIGDATVVMPMAVINYGAKVGSGCIVNTNACIEHDCVIDEGVHLSPGCHLAGDVVVGGYSWIGLGASIIQQVKVSSFVTVGAGAVVVNDLPPNITALGVPAKIKQ